MPLAGGDRNPGWGERCDSSGPSVWRLPAVSRSVERCRRARTRGAGDRRRGLAHRAECPYKAHVCILSGSVVPDDRAGVARGSRRRTSRTCASWRHPLAGAPVAEASTAIARTRDVMIHWSPAWNSMCGPRPTQPSIRFARPAPPCPAEHASRRCLDSVSIVGSRQTGRRACSR